MPSMNLRGCLNDKSSNRFNRTTHSQFFELAFHLKQVSDSTEYRIEETLPVFNQGEWGSCVLNAWVGALEILHLLDSGNVEPLSRAWLYALCQLEMNTFNQDSGTFPFLAADRLMNIGIVPESAWPYIPNNLPATPRSPVGFQQAHPTGALYIEASDNKITGAFRIDLAGTDRLDAVEQSVRANHPVVWGALFNVDQLSNWMPGDSALEPPSNQTGLGGHSTLITGVLRTPSGRRWFRVRNSWWNDWGDNGYFYVSDNYIASPLASDFWVGTLMQGLIV